MEQNTERKQTQERITAIRQRRHEKTLFGRLLLVLAGIIVLLFIVIAILFIVKVVHPKQDLESLQASETETQSGTDELGTSLMGVSAGKESAIKATLAQAELLAAGYDYEQASALVEELLKTYPDEEELEDELKKLESERKSLVVYDGIVSHVFFHSLIVDPERAFDGDSRAEGYDSWMTTVDEFEAMMQSMYDRGYVLVSIHDIATVSQDSEGNVSCLAAGILLPEGKTPFILSVDDVSYYTYMEGDGFADRLVVDEDGRVKCEYTDSTGKVMTGDYDVVPILDRFIEEHPDFSYRGAKGLLALTGYNGCLGYHYRMKDAQTGTYELTEDYEELMQEAKTVASAMKKSGWEFASHGWGHRHSTQIDYDTFVKDTEIWKAEVAQIVGDTDVYVYPYGEEVLPGDEKFDYLRDQGFVFLCGVDSSPFLKIGDNYVRSARRNLDGYSMYNRPEKLEDLFDVSEVLDERRPEQY